MTMGRAVILLVLSGLLAALGVVLVAVRINSGLIDSSIAARDSGAHIGSNAATPTGGGGRTSPGAAGATVTAAIKTATALLGGAKTAVPTGRDVTQVPVGASTEVNGSRYTVIQVMDPEAPGFFTTTAGNRRVALEVTQEAISGTVQYSFSSFRIRDAAGQEYTWAITNTEPKFDSGMLKQGESKRGWISFQVPAGIAVDALILQVPGQAKGTAIVSLK
ncbi:MAG: DUF4352 domain-containing protein [bacterium]